LSSSELFTGDKRVVYWPGGFESDGVVTVVHEDPLPFTLRGIVLKVVTGD